MSTSESTYTRLSSMADKYARMMTIAQNEGREIVYRDALEKYKDTMSKLVSLPTSPATTRSKKSSYLSPFYGSGNTNTSRNTSYYGLSGTAELYGIRCGSNGGSESLSW